MRTEEEIRKALETARKTRATSKTTLKMKEILVAAYEWVLECEP